MTTQTERLMTDKEERAAVFQAATKKLAQQDKISRIERRKRILAIPDDEWETAKREDVDAEIK